MITKVIAHQMYVASSNGVLEQAVKMLAKKYPQYKSLISFCSKETIVSPLGFEYSFAKINEVAKAFKANRAAAGIKEPSYMLA